LLCSPVDSHAGSGLADTGPAVFPACASRFALLLSPVAARAAFWLCTYAACAMSTKWLRPSPGHIIDLNLQDSVLLLR